MRNLQVPGMIFMFALAAFVGVGIDYLNVGFNTSTRWIFLVLLIVSLLPRGEIFMAYRSNFAPFMLAYLLWCFATAAWSQVPLLSMLKAIALLTIATAFIGAGQVWARRQQPSEPIVYLAPVLIIALFAGFFEHKSAIQTGTGVMIYQGLAGNPNYLGIMVAAALPLPIYKMFVLRRREENLAWLVAWGAVLVLLLFLLWKSGSRASMLCALTLIATFGSIVNSGRRISIAILFVAIFAGVVVAAPEIEQGVYERVIVKGTGNDAFFSRREAWQKSYEGAQEGGVLGVGYGVSAGFEDFDFGLTAHTYGREKGNAQLAVWEETGLVGLGFYAILVLMLFRELLAGLAACSAAEDRAQLSLLIGLTAGMLVQSCFEAWWTSPGSMESAIFWSTVGVATAVAKRYTTGARGDQAHTLVALRGRLMQLRRVSPIS